MSLVSLSKSEYKKDKEWIKDFGHEIKLEIFIKLFAQPLIGIKVRDCFEFVFSCV